MQQAPRPAIRLEGHPFPYVVLLLAVRLCGLMYPASSLVLGVWLGLVAGGSHVGNVAE